MYPVIYSKTLQACGMTKGPIVWIREDMRGNLAVLEHELVHVKQWFAVSMLGLVWAAGCYLLGHMQYAHFGILSLALHSLLYTLIPAYKQWAEVQAFRTQIKFGGDAYSCATALSKDYGLKLSVTSALKLLEK